MSEGGIYWIALQTNSTLSYKFILLVQSSVIKHTIASFIYGSLFSEYVLFLKLA